MTTQKTLFTFLFIFINLIVFSQTIGTGSATMTTDFSKPLLSGVYNSLNQPIATSTPDASNTWQHLIVANHNSTNNCQLQIASSFSINDRLFFRKMAVLGQVNSNTTWFEIATRNAANNFIGNQSISGELKVSSYSPLLVLQRNQVEGGFIQGIQTKNSDNTNNWFFGNLQANSWIVSKGDFQNPKLTILENGNTGIGTIYPKTKLDVFGDLALNFDSGISTIFRKDYGSPNAGALDFGDGTGWKFNIRRRNDNKELVTFLDNGKVGIGTKNPSELLTVNGKIHAEEIIVTVDVLPDYVFQKYYTGKSELKADYVMPTLAEIESFTKKNSHLPNVPSAQEVQEKGVSLGEMSNILLQKVEELTLYAIEQNKKAQSQQEEIERLKAENEQYQCLAERLAAIENLLKK